ncbi:hypothetical protein Hypma_008277 [Hypsizygus marmoreus]|uniref:Uncharacterized protein n=1 Tax=Hypsizygus marmoreus TaxID=39966 RepID=A0A369JY62_HYPMA|nr:hypothetical protein Hypma_008277 [Hypsizygus marmoreus]
MRFQSTASTAVLTALIAPALLVSAAPVLDPTTVGKTAPAPPPSIQHQKSHITRPGEGGSGVPPRFDAKVQSKEPRRPTGLGVRKSSQKKVTGVAERDLVDFDFESLLARALEDLGLETRTPKRPGEGGSGIPPRFDTNPQPKEPNRPTGVGYKWQQDQLKRAGEKKKAAEKRSGTPPRVKTPPPKEPNRPTGSLFARELEEFDIEARTPNLSGRSRFASVTGRDFVDDDLESLFARELEEFDIEARTPTRPGYKWQQDMLKKAGEKKKAAEKKKGQGAGAVAGRDLVDEESVLALRDFVATFLDELD